MTYPGNSSLSEDIQERIQSTYRQTLELAAQGNRQEASLGCDFILRLDTEFAPARKLLERLESGDGPVSVDDLRPGAPGYTDGRQAPVPSEEEASPADPTDLAEGDLKTEMRSLLEAGEHEEVVLLAQAERERVQADPELREIVRTAQNRQEADPYIQSFLGKAREALRHDEMEQARQFLSHARELDPEHPAIRDFAAVLEARAPQTSPEQDELPDLELDALDLSEESAPEPEESLAGGFSLDDTASSGESDSRIRELLDEGQAAFDRGELQEAIDAWSRIFLIDIDHQEAAKRIDKARSLKDERERQVEETFHDAVSKLEAGQTQKAQELFSQVLELQPGHLAAREYLQDIEEGRAPEAEPQAAPKAPPGGLGLPEEPTQEEPLSHEILVPPEPGAASEPAPAPAAADSTTSSSTSTSTSTAPSRTFLWVGGLVLLLVVAAAWFFFQRRDTLFPNANQEAAAPAAADPIELATGMHEAGRTEQALARLRQIPQSAEQYEDAQALISQWQAEATSGEEAPSPGRDGGAAAAPTAAEEADRRSEWVADARRWLDSEQNLRALAALDQADAISPLSEDERRLRQRARERLEPLASEIEIVRGGDWELALRDLWRLHQANPDDQDVIRLLVTSYYNLGVRDLQRGDTTSAAESFEEALAFRPDDPELQRHLRFARAYDQRSKDLLYEIYARKLSFRTP